MNLIARERRRLRRKFIEKVSTRDIHAIDRWWDWELARTALPAVPGLFLGMVDGRSATSDWLLGVGVLFAIPWFLWVLVQILSVYSRFGDKQYMLVTRKLLAKEYQS